MRRKIVALFMTALLLVPNGSFAQTKTEKEERDRSPRLHLSAKKKTKKTAGVKTIKKDYFINGSPVTLEVFTRNNVTMVAARDLVEPLEAMLQVMPIPNDDAKGIAVIFANYTHQVGYRLDSTVGVYSAGSVDKLVELELPVGATMIVGRTYVPLRVTVEKMGGTLTPVGMSQSPPSSDLKKADPSKQTPKVKEIPVAEDPVLNGPFDTTMKVGDTPVNVRVLYADDVLMVRFEDLATLGYQTKKEFDKKNYFFITHEQVANTIMYVEGKRVVAFVEGELGTKFDRKDVSEKKIKMRPITVNGETFLELQPILDVMQMKVVN
ncbi:MAG: hypothetical protein Q4A75_07190 [Peptostreptococcaceae bacterium]|nr:hypothetical protein [Peptostreptococcaceae bacterium]